MSDLVIALSAIAILLVIWAFVRLMNANNTLEWYQLVSSKLPDGTQSADWNQIGKGVGVCICVWLPAMYAYSSKMEPYGLTAVMSAALLYLGGVSSYAATLRSKQGSIETSKVTESSPLATVTEKITQNAPIGDQK